ncbi:MAG: hypothetical protein NT059_09685 [Planctomycetota bacterium]|nr:hypothetical protein [Planctomycetota bacterium]
MLHPICTRPIDTYRRILAAISAMAVTVVVGCTPSPEVEQTVRDVDISAFSAPPKGPLPEVVSTPLPQVEPPGVTDIERTVTLADGTKVIRKEEVITAVDPTTEKEASQFIDEGSQRTLRVGQRWLVESLIGQINGRPIFAEEIFKQIEAAVLLASQDPNPESARTQVDALVRRAFRQQVESELILAEAESRLSPEMKVGLLGWLRDLQETTIAQRGGNRASAEEALRDEMQMSVEEFVTFRKNAELTRDILRRKVEPRVVVSWRDVERLYRQRHAAYEPDPIYRLGRIRLAKEQQADKIEVVKRMITEKKTFTEIADAVGTPEHGMWRAVTVADGKMMVSDMTNDLQKLIAPLQPGMISEPLDARTSMTWFAVISEETPPRMSIFDTDLQLSLRGELQGTQERLEQARYIQSLQKRWLGASITKMEIRLVQIARERYLDPLRPMKGAQQGPAH